MPIPGLRRFLRIDRGAGTVDRDVDEARRIMAELAEVGIDIDAVTAQLEEEGIASFTKSYDALIAGVESKRSQLAEALAAR